MPRILIGAMLKWYLHHTAKAFENSGALCGYWVSNANITGIDEKRYRRIWPYHVLKKLFYHLPSPSVDEWSRWWFLPAYDAWVRRQRIPESMVSWRMWRLSERSKCSISGRHPARLQV